MSASSAAVTHAWLWTCGRATHMHPFQGNARPSSFFFFPRFFFLFLLAGDQRRHDHLLRKRNGQRPAAPHNTTGPRRRSPAGWRIQRRRSPRSKTVITVPGTARPTGHSAVRASPRPAAACDWDPERRVGPDQPNHSAAAESANEKSGPVLGKEIKSRWSEKKKK